MNMLGLLGRLLERPQDLAKGIIGKTDERGTNLESENKIVEW